MPQPLLRQKRAEHLKHKYSVTEIMDNGRIDGEK